MSTTTAIDSVSLADRAQELAGRLLPPSANAETGCLRMLLASYGIALDEHVLFGLDSSFGFMFHQRRNTDPDIIVGKNEVWPCRAPRLLGMHIKSEAFPTIEMVEKRSNELYASGSALVVRVDLGMLPYFDNANRRHFGGHFVLAWGAEDARLLISDPFIAEPLLVSSHDVQRARTSKLSPPINPNSYTCWFEPPSRQPDIRVIGALAIRQTVRTMVHPPLRNFGLSGLRTFAAAVADWPVIKGNALKAQLTELAQQIDEFGTGGGLMRPLFAKFLTQLGSLLEQNDILVAAAHLEQAGAYWGELAQRCREGAEADAPAAAIPEIVQQLSAIANYEDSCFKLLRKI